MILKKLSFEHLAQMAEIEKEAFDAPWNVNMFIPELASKDAHYVVGLEGGEVVCYGGFHQIFDEAHIMNIAVKKEYRGRGFGTELMSSLIARAKLLGIVRMTLEVSATNAAGMNLYGKFGFKAAGRRPRYYENGSDAIIMWKEF